MILAVSAGSLVSWANAWRIANAKATCRYGKLAQLLPLANGYIHKKGYLQSLPMAESGLARLLLVCIDNCSEYNCCLQVALRHAAPQSLTPAILSSNDGSGESGMQGPCPLQSIGQFRQHPAGQLLHQPVNHQLTVHSWADLRLDLTLRCYCPGGAHASPGCRTLAHDCQVCGAVNIVAVSPADLGLEAIAPRPVDPPPGLQQVSHVVYSCTPRPKEKCLYSVLECVTLMHTVKRV